MFSSLIQAVISKYNEYYYYKVECKSCKRKFLRDKRFEIMEDDNVCSIQCFLNLKHNIV